MDIFVVIVVRDYVHEIYWIVNDVLLWLVDSLSVIWLFLLETEIVMLENILLLILVKHEKQRHQLRVAVRRAFDEDYPCG